MQIGDLLDRHAIALRIHATDKHRALAVIAEIAARNFGLDAGDVLDALTDREQAGSTGVGHGVAAPHARLEGLTRLRGIFVQLDHAVEFEAVDDQPVDLIFALFAPKEAAGVEQLRQARSADAIHALLVQDPVSRSSAA